MVLKALQGDFTSKEDELRKLRVSDNEKTQTIAELEKAKEAAEKTMAAALKLNTRAQAASVKHDADYGRLLAQIASERQQAHARKTEAVAGLDSAHGQLRKVCSLSCLLYYAVICTSISVAHIAAMYVAVPAVLLHQYAPLAEDR